MAKSTTDFDKGFSKQRVRLIQNTGKALSCMILIQEPDGLRDSDYLLFFVFAQLSFSTSLFHICDTLSAF